MNPDDIRQLITLHEGVRAKVYKDTRGKRTIGVGFNLDQPGAAQILQAALGPISYTSLLSGAVALTAEQIAKLLDHCIAIAVEDAKELVQSFDYQPEQVQLVLIDMIFNLGKAGLAHFVKFLAAVSREDYKAAIAEIQFSAWRHQVGARAGDAIALLSQVVNHRSFEEAKSVPSTSRSLSASSK